MGVQAKAGPRAVHVGTANERQAANDTQPVNKTQLRVVQVGTKTPATQVRAVRGRTAVQKTRLRTSVQDRFQAKRDMADVAVVAHPHEDEEHEVEHPHEDEEHEVEDPHEMRSAENSDPWEVQRTNAAGSVAGPSRC